MLKHLQLGRRVSFPLIFLVAGAVLFGTGFLVLKSLSMEPSVQPKSTFELLLAATGAAAAFVYFLYNQHHQDMQTFVSLFEKFNKRYDSLNEKLNAIMSRPIDSPLISEHINTLYDYFNLCAEEHLFYEAGYIDERVWRAWLCGMKHFAADAAVRRLWEHEIKSRSYYDFKLSLVDAVNCSPEVP
jgi:hypothetical protein